MCHSARRRSRNFCFQRPAMAASTQSLKVAIAGLGAIGLTVARRLDAGAIPGLSLAAVSARDHGKARKTVGGLKSAPAILDLAALPDAADIVVECLPARNFAEIAEPAVER